MGEFGSATPVIDRLVERAGAMSLEEAADLYRAQAARLLIQGSEAERRALAEARRAAKKAGLEDEFEHARQAAAAAWRHALPDQQGPWLLVGQAIADAAGALVVGDLLDDRAFKVLVGPWRQAFGLTPMGPGLLASERAQSR
jgi:hypothetical protein